MNSSKYGLVLLGAFLAIGLTLGGYFIGQTMYNGKVAINTAEAKGLAERVVEADRAEWTIQFSRTFRNKNEMKEQYSEAEKQQEIIVNLLLNNGIPKDDILRGAITLAEKKFLNDKNEFLYTEYTLNGTVGIVTSKVNLLRDIWLKVNKLIVDGIDINAQEPAYYFTKLNEIKPAMLEEATKNAWIAANEFAKNANAKVGGIRSAEQGSFYIVDEGDNYDNNRKIKKTVRVVTTISFYLKDSL